MEERKSKPLSDITNSFGVTPIAALVEFLASTSNINSVSKTKTLTPKDNISSGSEKFGSSKRSESSIGSSSVAASRNPRRVQLRDPSTIEVSSIKTRSGGGNKDAARSRQKLIGNIKGNDVVIVNPQLTEARKDRGKTVGTPITIRPSLAKGVGAPLRSALAEEIKVMSDHCLKERENEKSVADSSSWFAMGIEASAGKRCSDVAYEKRNSTKQGVDESSASSSIPGSKQAANFSSSSQGRKEFLQPSSSRGEAINGGRGIGKGEKRKKTHTIGSSSCGPIVKTRHQVNASKSWSNPRPNASKKRCSKVENESSALELIEKQKAYFREVDEFQLDEEEISQDELDQ